MQVPVTSAELQPEAAQEKSNWFVTVLFSPWVLGAAFTYAFYSAVPFLPIEREFVTRYFCGHWIEYATTGLFFLGITILGKKALALIPQMKALHVDMFGQSQFAEGASSVDRARMLLGGLQQLPTRLRRTVVVDRVRDVCQYVLGRGNSETVEDHIKYLADVAANDLHGSYALVRTTTWAIPILGFLGTVIGITMAIANVTPEQLESSLGEVTAGLAVAFDTTALSLTLSMLMVFATFLVERCESSILSRVETFGITRIAHCFPQGAEVASTNPFASAEARAADDLIKRTEALITWQTNLWQDGLETMRGRWMETADQQQSQFSSTLQQGMALTLGDHAKQLNDLRSEFLNGFLAVSKEMAGVAAGIRSTAEVQAEAFSRQVADIWDRIESQSVAIRSEQRMQAEQSTLALTGAIQGWHGDLSQATNAVTGQMEELRRQGETLLRITEQEHELARLQAKLQENLQAVREVEGFEETIHSLSAAVHLLTARTKGRIAA